MHTAFELYEQNFDEDGINIVVISPRNTDLLGKNVKVAVSYTEGQGVTVYPTSKEAYHIIVDHLTHTYGTAIERDDMMAAVFHGHSYSARRGGQA